MFGILFLLVAVFSGHEVASNVDTNAPQAAVTAPSIAGAPSEAGKADATAAVQPSASPAAVTTPGTAVGTLIAKAAPDASAAKPAAPPVRVAGDTALTASDDHDVDAALSRISDFYDATPPTPSAKAQSVKAQPVQASAAPSAARPALGLGLISARTDYVSEGRPVVIEIMRPDDDIRRPAVLILHGASGIGDGAFYRSTAELFAEHGYVTFLPHYLEAVHAKKAKGHAKAGTASAHGVPVAAAGSIRAGFPQQEQILRDAVDYVAHSPYVDASRIGVFGLSLGGFHALTLSSSDERIVAVVDMSGALRGNVMPVTNHLAPTLELHGAHDPIIPVARARALANTLQQLGIPHELQVYPNQGHFLRGKAQEDAMERATAFFATYLTPSDNSRAAQSDGGAN